MSSIRAIGFVPYKVIDKLMEHDFTGVVKLSNSEMEHDLISVTKLRNYRIKKDYKAIINEGELMPDTITKLPDK